MHNMGGYEAQSPFTSWTPKPEIAALHAAKHGPGGVVLRVPTGAPPPGATWRWEYQYHDEYAELEILLKGIRDGADVIKK